MDNYFTEILISIAVVPVLIILARILWTTRRKLKKLEARFKPVIVLDHEIDKLKKQKKQEQDQITSIRSDYQSKRAVFNKLVKEIKLCEENVEMMETGMYEPHFNFTDSEEYKIAIRNNKDKQKQMIKDKVAAICPTEWTVGGSKREGIKKTNRNIKLTLRAFNNECDSAIANGTME